MVDQVQYPGRTEADCVEDEVSNLSYCQQTVFTGSSPQVQELDCALCGRKDYRVEEKNCLMSI